MNIDGMIFPHLHFSDIRNWTIYDLCPPPFLRGVTCGPGISERNREVQVGLDKNLPFQDLFQGG
jgi:hypothetical protein